MESRKLFASALLFDMDGTIVDSKIAVEHAWAFWAKRHNLNLAGILEYSHGRPTLATMQFFGDQFAPGTDWQSEADEMQRMEQNEISGIVPIPGAREILSSLGDSPWAVVTSAPRGLAESRIAAAGLPLPRVLVPADEISRGKPDPEGYLKAASFLHAAAEECIVFEDTPPGVEAGLNGGMQVVALLTTVRADRLATDLRVRDLRDVQVRWQDGRFEVELALQ